MLVGTYTWNHKWIFTHGNQQKQGSVNLQQVTGKSDNQSYLAFSPDGKYVYAVNELGEESTVSAFALLIRKDETLFLNKVKCRRKQIRVLLRYPTNMFSRQIIPAEVFPYLNGQPDGTISEAVQVIRHPKKKFRQPAGFGNQCSSDHFSPDGKYLMATNLGTDRVITYSYNPTERKRCWRMWTKSG